MSMRALINGVETDCVSVADRGLQYGDGLFETIAVRDGGLCLWRGHFDRLFDGARRFGIPCPSQGMLLDECQRSIDSCSSGVLKIVLTRGSGGRGYRPPADPHPTRIVSLHPWPDYPLDWADRGVAVILCRTLLGENALLAGHKHLNRLEQVLARSEWRDPQIAEGIMQDGRGRVIGGTMSNLFLVSNGRLYTPRLDTCGVSGTARALVLRLAGEHDLEVTQADVAQADLVAADGLFLTNALIGVWPVRRLAAKPMCLNHLPGKLIAAVRRAALTPED